VEITLKLFATLGDYLPRELNGRTRVYNQLAINVAEAATVQAVIEKFRLPPAMAHLVLVNGVFIPRDARASWLLRPGDELAVWPPIAGG
jgi:sulfur carrier protein ThiS